MTNIFSGLIGLVACVFLKEPGLGLVCATLGFCTQYLVDELREIKNQLNK